MVNRGFLKSLSRSAAGVNATALENHTPNPGGRHTQLRILVTARMMAFMSMVFIVLNFIDPFREQG